VFLVDRETETYELAASRGVDPDRTVRSKDVERSLCDWAVRHKGPCLRTEDLATDPLLAHFGGTWGAAIAVPLITGGGPVGVIVAAVRQRHALTEDSVRFMEALAAQAATAVENAMLYRQTAYWAIRDGLTGLYNYRHFAERLEIELARATRYQTPVSLLVIDVDLFKNVNDDYGHLVGDEVLRALAERLVETTRESDLVARYGGEEFVVICPETDYEGATRAAGKLRDAVVEGPLVTLGPDRTEIGVTISIGLATYPTTSTADHIVSQADEALYDAKSRRDCVCSVRGCLAGGSKPL
jgi:diguanylate cyclase (GGDEF)-like protein